MRVVPPYANIRVMRERMRSLRSRLEDQTYMISSVRKWGVDLYLGHFSTYGFCEVGGLGTVMISNDLLRQRQESC